MRACILSDQETAAKFMRPVKTPEWPRDSYTTGNTVQKHNNCSVTAQGHLQLIPFIPGRYFQLYERLLNEITSAKQHPSVQSSIFFPPPHRWLECVKVRDPN
ncbi:hypothetical protein O3P69_006888 [Scylla paramamosain]|uniref:Uncharacterized protein n=1 Tax=Scylla paramamosain TaxID=85552 RepID=A0AAW0U378_SCYPA